MKEYPRPGDSYGQLVQEVRSFQEESVEPLSPAARKEMILELAHMIYRGNEADKAEVIHLAKYLLKTDPLTDQQAGIVARTRRDWVDFTLDERLALMAGDWGEIEAIFKTRDDRWAVFEKNLPLIVPGNKKMIVYRELDLDPSSASKIKSNGLIPAGVSFCGGLNEAIFSEIHWSFGWGNRPENGRLSLDLTRWPIAKANLYQGVWEEGDFGMTNPYKLGQSTTTYQNLKNLGRARHGRLLIVLEIEAERLVREGGINDSWDHEHTFLFDASHDQIVAVYDASSVRTEEVWRLVSKNPLDALRRVGKRLA